MSAGLRMYRTLLRTVSVTFKGDEMMLTAARRELRAKFQENRAVHEPAAVAQRLAEGAEANDFIRNYIVQALKNPKTGQFEVDARQAGRLKDAAQDLARPGLP